MKHFFIYSIVLISFISARFTKGQSIAYLDSLEGQLSVKMPDTARVSLLLNLAGSYAFKDFAKSLNYAKEAASLAEKTNEKFYMLQANRELGLIYNLGGDYTTALSLETKSLEIAIELNDSTQIGKL